MKKKKKKLYKIQLPYSFIEANVVRNWVKLSHSNVIIEFDSIIIIEKCDFTAFTESISMKSNINARW